MSGSPTGTSTVERRRTRRQFLRRSVGMVGIGLAVAGSASGQGSDIFTSAVIAEQPEYDSDLVGFWLHIDGEVTPNEAAAVDDDCGFVDWPDEETVAYDAALLDRRADPQQSRVTLYLHERVEIAPGTLFIVNGRQQCQSGYVGLELERIGANPGVSDDPTADRDGGGAVADETTSGDGAGFGVLGVLAGALGAGWLLDRRRDRDD